MTKTRSGFVVGEQCIQPLLQLFKIHGLGKELVRTRDQFGVDAQTRAINDGGVPTDSTQRFSLNAPSRSAVARFNGERIVVQNWPLAEKRVVFAEFHY